MRHTHSGDGAKGWFGGAWNWDLAVSVGTWANEGIDDPHEHR